MSPEERAQMECAIEEDSSLHAEVERIRRIDAHLRELMPATVLTDEKIAERIMANIETPDENSINTDTNVLSFPVVAKVTGNLIFRRALIGLAAAAVILIVAMPRLTTQTIRWEQPHFESPQYRGEEAGPGTFGQESATRCFEMLRDAVDEAHGSRGVHKRNTDWTLAFSCQVLIDGNICIHVRQLDRESNMMKEWIEHYSGAESFAGMVDDFAARIAADLKCAGLNHPEN